MKTKLFISFAAFAAASVLMSSCSNEESTATANDQLTTFTGGIVTEVPMERVQIGTPGVTTRTSMNRSEINGDGSFLWEPNDVICVVDDGGKLYKSQNTIQDAAPRVKFLVYGSYTNKNEYDVYYYGTNSGAGEKKVVIADHQTPSDFNNTKHFGAVGDCGVAKAVKNTEQGKSGFKFDLQHKASYLCFLPYLTTKEKRDAYKIKSIEITSDNNICGTYDLTQNGLTGDGNAKTITLHAGSNGLLLANKNVETADIMNSLYAVIAPGQHILSVKYTVLDTKDNNKELTLVKKYKSHDFGANKICNIPVNLDATSEDGGHAKSSGTSTLEEGIEGFSYTGKNYYMWDAAKNYWFGYEWDATVAWQPTVRDATNDSYPKSNTADPYRWYHEGSGFIAASVNPLFKQLPNANEMAWYVLRGDAHWDYNTQWEAFGTTHNGGLWLKKLDVIAKENGKNPADLKLKDPNGNNLLTNTRSYDTRPEYGKPSDSEIGKYFFLPVLGYYSNGRFFEFGMSGGYWTSSADPGDRSKAYRLYFNFGTVVMQNDDRDIGFVAQPFE